ncbi:GNAT family N-acetyltransferase [Haloarchaeobius amylolyticus]|uniref:GNAT family N-acetyltransferase n=1 Tax=Haloarchaeobius amylolyticus TaxID=1198296 RepID=A0ABD6BID6_9EURY
MTETYTIRRFREGDLEGYLSLYADVFGTRPDEEWFQWKYRDNPYVDHVPIYVAVVADEIVGARSFFALPLWTGQGTILALQPCDTMVHEAHRRKGLFTRMTEAAIEGYRNGEPELCFNFPNSKTRSGNQKLGWRITAEKELYYRIHDPAAVAGATGNRGVIELASSVVSPVAKGYLAVRDFLSDAAEPGVTVRRHETIPAECLESLYREAVPDGFHVVRDEQFLQWRFRNPNWEYEVYIATSDNRDVAAMITGTDRSADLTKTMIVDVLSVDGESAAVLDRLLSAVLEDNQTADLIVALGNSIHDDVLLKRGFLPDSKPPLSPITETTTLMVRPLSDAESQWTIGGKAIDDARNWETTFISHDRN